MSEPTVEDLKAATTKMIEAVRTLADTVQHLENRALFLELRLDNLEETTSE